MKRSELKHLISESVMKHLINESFASSILKKKIMDGGGIDQSDRYSNNAVGILNSLTDADIIDAAIHYDDNEYEPLYVTLKNGETLNILVKYDRLSVAQDRYDMRKKNQEDTDEYGNPDKVYRGAHAGMGTSKEPWLGNDMGAAYNDAMKDFKNGWDAEYNINQYKDLRNRIR